MEGSTTNISYKGSVTDAISETQKQKKLFVVYISGDDADSTLLEQSVWADNRVAVSISKYCIFLHLVQGSIDAMQFSAIYPQKSVPSITAVGYNGIKLWQHEGYTSVENFVASIEKAWASLHLQETTLTLLTQVLASKKPETLGSSSQIAGDSSTSNTGSSSAAKVIDNLDGKPTQEPELQEQEMISETVEDNDKMPGLQTSLQSNTAVKVKEDPKISHSSKKENLGSVTTDIHSSLASRDIDSSVIPEETEEKLSEINTVVTDDKTKNEEVPEPADCSNVVKSNDINLNIRMPDGGSLKRKFMMTDTLRSVKQYISENLGSGISSYSYDLAIPYPRKVFTEQDMDIILSELGFAARQALIVVPHRQANMPPSTSNPQHSTSMVVSTDGSNDGYFALLKRALSFVNPLSYLGGNTNPSNFEPAPHTPHTESNSYQYQPYRPIDALQGRLLSGTASSTRPSVQTQTNHSLANQSTGEIRRRTVRPFGSNIHTLKHDEEDMQSRDNNTFWNGNSTQYGGDDKK